MKYDIALIVSFLAIIFYYYFPELKTFSFERAPKLDLVHSGDYKSFDAKLQELKECVKQGQTSSVKFQVLTSGEIKITDEERKKDPCMSKLISRQSLKPRKTVSQLELFVLESKFLVLKKQN